MSEWHPVVVKLEKIERHPNADTLEMSTLFGGYTVIFKEGRFKEGDLAAYIPVDSVCSDHTEFDWLGDKKRIKAVRLRGIFSLGILAEAPADMVEGESVTDFYKLTKYVYEEEAPDVPGRHNGDHASPPKSWTMPHYDLEGIRKYGHVLQEGEDVVITEKIEGCNAAFAYAPDAPDGDPLWVKSRNYYLKEDLGNLYWYAAQSHNLGVALEDHPGKVFFAELYGQVKGFKYDCTIDQGKVNPKLRFFDVWDVATLSFLPWEQAETLIKSIGLQTVPVLYRGPWTGKDLWKLAEGKSSIGENIREGFVVRTAVERYVPRFGRVILKLKGEEYMLKKK